jgi:hypothetical protein
MDTSSSHGQVAILFLGVVAASFFVISLYALYLAFPRYQKLLQPNGPAVYNRLNHDYLSE